MPHPSRYNNPSGNSQVQLWPRIVASPLFDIFFACMILTNAVFIGFLGSHQVTYLVMLSKKLKGSRPTLGVSSAELADSL